MRSLQTSFHRLKKEGRLPCYLKTSYTQEHHGTIQHSLFLPWRPGLLLHSIPHTVVWTCASQCFWFKWDDPQTSCQTSIKLNSLAGQWHDWLVAERCVFGDGFWLFVHLQFISERVLSALACLLVERMVCLTAERGWNKERRRQKFSDKATGSGSIASSHSILTLISPTESGDFWNLKSRTKRCFFALRLCIIALLCTPNTVCLQQAPLLVVNSPQGFFHSSRPTQCCCCQRERSTMVF